MAAPRFLALVSGRIKQALAITSSAGAGDAEKIVATAAGTGIIADSLMGAAETGNSKVLKTKSDGTIDASVLPAGIGADTVSVVTSENLAAGDLVNIYDVAGTATARKADATAEGKEVSGFVIAGTTSPAAATVYFGGKITGLSGKTPGARQYMSATPGALTETPPSTTGNVVQYVGLAYSATAVSFDRDEPITVA
jgi:hypothetical protein